MKTKLMFCLILLLPGCVGMPQSQEEWLFHTANIVDTAQTIQVGKSFCYYENNAITKNVLGDKPKAAETIGYMLLISWAHRAVTVALEDSHPLLKQAFESISVGDKMNTVAKNYNRGVEPFGRGC